MQTRTEVQQRYQAAIDSLVARLQQDRYVRAAILYGSLARGEAWERSDIDVTIVQQDGLDRETRCYTLVEDGIPISASVISRGRLRHTLEGSLQGSMDHSIFSQSKLLFSKDESIAAWFQEDDRIGARDQSYQLLRVATWIPPVLDKEEKWFYVKDDLRYSFLWILYAVNRLAQVECVLRGEAPGREVIHQALKHNPSFFHAIYTELIDGPKDHQAIQAALERINLYMEERAQRLFRPLLDYLAEADGPRAASELEAHFQKKVADGYVFFACEWLARKGIVEKLAAPLRLTRKSQVTMEEPAYYYDGHYRE